MQNFSKTITTTTTTQASKSFCVTCTRECHCCTNQHAVRGSFLPLLLIEVHLIYLLITPLITTLVLTTVTFFSESL